MRSHFWLVPVACVLGALVPAMASAADPLPIAEEEQVVVDNAAFDETELAQPRDTLRAWLFRRYAGSVEMQEKVFYPPGYYGSYYFRGWKPDWIYPNPPPPDRHCADCEHPLPPGSTAEFYESRRVSPAWGESKKPAKATKR